MRRFFVRRFGLNLFPGVDPIPLPAPVWLFKLLSVVTLALHFAAMQLMVGGLTLATILNAFGKRDSAARQSSNSIIKKLPIVMVYVINFGVPPLLFAQVLYGQALYTSSVLIGAYWIAVIFLLIAAYYLLYLSADRAEQNKSWWPFGLVSIALVAYIGRIYSTNMTLMLRPEDWPGLYHLGGGLGTTMPKGDPTLLPRFLFMIFGSIGVAGAGMALLGAFSKESRNTLSFLKKWGAGSAAIFGIVQVILGYWVFTSQPDVVKSALLAGPLYYPGMIAWAATTGLFVVAALLMLLAGAKRPKLISAVLFLVSFISILSFAFVRDGIRDVTLAVKGLDVWQQAVVSNWSVVTLFLVLFLAGLGLIGYILYAVSRSARDMAASRDRILEAETLSEKEGPATAIV